MATGDQDDVSARTQALMPAGWFTAGMTPIEAALITAAGYLGSFIYSLIAYLVPQTRIATATDGFLDLIAQDYFGPPGASTALLRQSNQSDASYRANIQANLLRQRNTRAAVIAVLEQITGETPVIFEPARPMDTGCYRGPTLGYGVAGGYGSLMIPGQAFVIAYRPAGSGIPNIAGYGISTGAYSTPSQAEFASLSMIQDTVTDADIYAAVNSVRPITRILWVRITNPPVPASGGDLLTEDGLVIDTESGVPISIESSTTTTRILTEGGVTLDTESGNPIEVE